MKYGKVAIIGTGLIGGSIGKALLKKRMCEKIVGVCRRESSRERAIRENAVTECFINDYEQALKDAEVIIIATPVETEKEVLKKISLIDIRPGAIITDVGSTKKDIVDFASGFCDRYTFVGSHPLAGSEKTGVEYASADLFMDSVCVITPGEKNSEGQVKDLTRFWKGLGANVKVLAPAEHDLILAYTSHLPHIAAYALAGSTDENYAPFISTGFKDTTRIASSDPQLWADIFLTNSDNVLKSIEKYKKKIASIQETINKGDRGNLVKLLKEFKRIKDGII